MMAFLSRILALTLVSDPEKISADDSFSSMIIKSMNVLLIIVGDSEDSTMIVD